MGFVIFIILVVLAMNLGVGFGLAALFFKDGPGRTAGGFSLTLLSICGCVAIVWAACGNVLK